MSASPCAAVLGGGTRSNHTVALGDAAKSGFACEGQRYKSRFGGFPNHCREIFLLRKAIAVGEMREPEFCLFPENRFVRDCFAVTRIRGSVRRDSASGLRAAVGKPPSDGVRTGVGRLRRDAATWGKDKKAAGQNCPLPKILGQQ
ncbi:hypothetical protein [Tahibacter sp.]|uniref:hypothetical protein n=1 Tax=Tahibacter sp. TaxID=2056211 RepID=UPI0028C470C5|nr:hypothetical protein [Tahibacter sp.]